VCEAGTAGGLPKSSASATGPMSTDGPHAVAIEHHQARALVHHLERVVRGVGLHGEVLEGLALHHHGPVAVEAHLADRQVPEPARVGRVVVDLEPEIVAPDPRIEAHPAADPPAGAGAEHRHAARRRQRGLGGRRVGRWRRGRRSKHRVGHAHDPRLGTAVQEELLHRVRRVAAAFEAAVLALEVGEAEYLYRLVEESLAEGSDEGAHRRGDSDDGADTARNLLDVDARIGRLDRHTIPLAGWYASPPARRAITPCFAPAGRSRISARPRARIGVERSLQFFV
jgi:hypothetical protein